eukprot:263568_1
MVTNVMCNNPDDNGYSYELWDIHHGNHYRFMSVQTPNLNLYKLPKDNSKYFIPDSAMNVVTAANVGDLIEVDFDGQRYVAFIRHKDIRSGKYLVIFGDTSMWMYLTTQNCATFTFNDEFMSEIKTLHTLFLEQRDTQLPRYLNTKEPPFIPPFSAISHGLQCDFHLVNVYNCIPQPSESTATRDPPHYARFHRDDHCAIGSSELITGSSSLKCKFCHDMFNGIKSWILCEFCRRRENACHTHEVVGVGPY